MSDKIDFSFAFDLAAKQPDSAQAPELICIHPLEIQPLDGQQSLAVSLRNGKSSVIPNFLAGPLQGLSVFRKLEEQVQQLLPQLGNQISQQQLTESLRSLLAAGLFQSSRSLCASINSGSEAPAQLAASRVFILTCDRLPAAERLVASIFDNADLSQHEALYLLDDSRDSAALQGNRALLDKYQQRSPIPLRYFGPQEKRAYLERLCEQLPGAASNIRFLLDRECWSGQKTYGVSRNWALVLSAGYRCLMLDDDVLCEALYPPYQKDQLRLSNSNIIDVFASEADWRSEARPTGFDPLAGHLRHLGQDLHTCLKHYSGKGLSEAEMENMLEAETRHLQADSRILISECGAWGDPGCPLHTLLLNSNPHSTERMLARDPDLGHSFGKRQLRSIQQSVKIDHIANIAQITGVDNSALLPPYFPALRGEDGLFGSLVHYLYPESRVLTHNWGVPHLPMDERSGSYRDEAVIPPVHIGAITRYIDEQYQLAATGSTTNRYAFIAGVLRDFASKPQAELLALARREGQRGAAAVHARAAERLPYFSGKSPAFTAYLQYAQQSAAEWLRQPPSLAAQFGMPAELPEADVITAITGAVSSFAGGLDEWPAIREAVIAINQQN